MNCDIEQEPSRKWVLTHFDVIEEAGGKRKRKCLAPDCEKEYVFNTSTSHMKRHWAIVHKENELKQTVFCLHNEYHIHCLVKLIIMEQLEYRLVDSLHFRNFVRSLNTVKSMPSRNAISSTLIDKTLELQDSIKHLLEDAMSVALTTDLWSASNSSRGFMVITVHFIDKSMILRGFTLEFKRLYYPHDSQTLADVLIRTIKLFQIERKVIAITSDNDSSIIKAVKEVNDTLKLTENFGFQTIHLRCLGHVINLAAKSALEKMKSFVSPIKTVALQLTNSIKHNEAFLKIQQDMLQVPGQSLLPVRKPLEMKLDCDTRWNSVLMMLQRALLLRHPIDEALVIMKHLREHQPPLIINWMQIKSLIDFLEPCNRLTVDASGQKYVAISTVTTHTPVLAQHAGRYTCHPYLGRAATALEDKLRSYSDYLTNDLTVIATILDPRIKISFLNAPEQQVYETKLRDLASKISLDDTQSSDGSMESQSAIDMSLGDDIYRPIYRDPEINIDGDEIRAYLGGERSYPDTEVLDYWKTNMKKLPKLSRLARTILCIQATSVASERAFSIAGAIDIPKRNRLTDDSFRANLLLRSWLEELADK